MCVLYTVCQERNRGCGVQYPNSVFIFPPLLLVSDWMQHAHVFSKLLCSLGLVLHHLTTAMMFLVFAIQACLWCRTQVGAAITVYSCIGTRSWSRASFIYVAKAGILLLALFLPVSVVHRAAGIAIAAAMGMNALDHLADAAAMDEDDLFGGEAAGQNMQGSQRGKRGRKQKGPCAGKHGNSKSTSKAGVSKRQASKKEG